MPNFCEQVFRIKYAVSPIETSFEYSRTDTGKMIASENLTRAKWKLNTNAWNDMAEKQNEWEKHETITKNLTKKQQQQKQKK